MLPDRVSNPGPLTYESGVLPIALHGPAFCIKLLTFFNKNIGAFQILTVKILTKP